MLHLKLFTTVPSFVYDFRICRNSSLFMSRKKSFLTPFCVTCPAIRHSYQQFKNCIVSSLLLLQTTTMMMRRITHSSSAAAAEESARPIFFFRRSRCRRRHCHRRDALAATGVAAISPDSAAAARARSPPSPNRRFPSEKKIAAYLFPDRPRKQFFFHELS